MTRPSRNQPPRGITLIEVVVVVAIVSIMFIVLVELYRAYSRLYTHQQATVDTAGSATVTANELQALGLQADSVAANTTISGTTYTSSATTLVLRLPSVDASENTVPNAYDYAVFYRAGAVLYRILSPNIASTRASSTKVLSDSVSALSFTYNNGTPSSASQITTDMQMQKATSTQAANYHLVQKIYLRNK